MPTTFITHMAVHYGFVAIGPKSDWNPHVVVAAEGQQNGLLGGRVQHSLTMVTGLHTGRLPFVVTWHDSPAPVDPEQEDVVEVSWTIPDETMTVGAFDEFHDIDLPPGPSRARYSARGMDLGRAMDTAHEEPAPDRYVLDLWAAEPEPERIVRHTSEIAAYWHGVARGEHR